MSDDPRDVIIERLMDGLIKSLEINAALLRERDPSRFTRTVAEEIDRYDEAPWPICPWCKTRHRTGCSYGMGDFDLVRRISEVEGISVGMAEEVLAKMRVAEGDG